MGTESIPEKRRRNLLVLIPLSLIILGGCSLCNIITAEPAKRIFDSFINLPPLIRPIWGIVVGLITIALLWLGAGIATGLARLPKVGLRILVGLVVFIGLPLALILLFAGPYLLMWLNTLNNTPDWKALEPAPERIIEIVDADINNVYVRTDTGKILHCATAEQGECWREASIPLTIMEKTRQIPFPPRLDPPGNSISTLGIAYDATAETGVEAYYALLMDGSIMWWRHESAHPYMTLFGWSLPLMITVGIIALFLPISNGAAITGLNRFRERSRP